MIQFLVFIIYVLIIALVNYFFKQRKKTGKEIFEVIGGLLFLFIAILFVGILTPFYLAQKNIIQIRIWPADLKFTILILAVFFFFARIEMIIDIFSKNRNFKKSISTFFGPLSVHFSSMLVSIGILYPYLKSILPLPLAILFSALSFAVYHFSQFHFFPDGIKIKFQLKIFVYSIGYVFFYALSGSFIFTFILQHLIAVTTFIYNKDYDFGERDFPFYFGVVTVVMAIVYAVLRMN